MQFGGSAFGGGRQSFGGGARGGTPFRGGNRGNRGLPGRQPRGRGSAPDNTIDEQAQYSACVFFMKGKCERGDNCRYVGNLLIFSSQKKIIINLQNYC
jgi:hypothetical protein